MSFMRINKNSSETRKFYNFICGINSQQAFLYYKNIYPKERKKKSENMAVDWRVFQLQTKNAIDFCGSFINSLTSIKNVVPTKCE